jgi:sulfonate transport system substrate-binding protein
MTSTVRAVFAVAGTAAVLAAAGLTKKDVTVDNLQPADALSAFSSGKIDAWDTWSPYIEEAVKQNGGRVLASGSQYGAPYAFQVASDAALSDKGKAAAISDYEKVLNQAYLWSKTHTSDWAGLWADATGLPSATMLQAAKDDVNTPVEIDGTVITAEQKLVDAFYKAGEIPTDVKMTDYMTGQFNSAVTGAATTSAGG